MKKRIFAIVMAVIMVTSLIAGAVPALAAEEDMITIRVHYHREDGNYEGWQLWSWDLDGKYSVTGTSATSSVETTEPPFKFEEGDGDVVATIKVPTGTMRVGYIVRYGDWEKKDIDYDQHINITGILSGTVDFYVESGKASQASADMSAIPSMEKLVADGFMKLGEDVVLGVVVTSASYNSTKNEVTVDLSAKLTYTADLSTFKVKNDDGEVEITKIVTLGSKYILTLAEPLDLARGYNVEFEGKDYLVSMPDYFSNAEFEDQFTYTGDDLGATYTKEKTDLRVWAPTAVDVKVNLYSNGDPVQQADPDEQVQMTKDVNGTWVATLNGDKNGTYYTYSVKTDNGTNEACDPYARTTGVNGKRAMIIDLDSTDPEGWDTDKDPHYDNNFTDAVIYELHVRDLSSDSSSGITNVGKFLGLIETGTKNSNGISTGLDHMKDLGITHVHLLPVYDYGSVDEYNLSSGQFNWGYDPVNYNVPEGSYSTDPFNGEVRVKEFKQMVKGLHDNGISVIMDVVYNHVYDANKFCVNQIVPGYFTRPNSNGSGCGNDVASERSMVSKYIVDSVTYWADEYHIDGFRFDLAGLLDTDTINAIIDSVHETHPNVKFYGEGWEMGTNVTKTGVTLNTMFNSTKVPEFAFFSDTIRNTVKGGTYGGVSAGFISGKSVSSSELNALYKGMPSWCKTPSQSINYISAHDNNTLFDHITLVTPNATVADRIAMNNLGAAFYITAQGIPFIHAGEEMLRSKPDASKDGGFNENSYNASDAVNSLKWDDLNKAEYMATYEYYKGLIAFRKAHPALRLTNSADVNSTVFPASGLDANVVAYTINGGINGETAESIYAIFNANSTAKTVTLPEGEWHICVNKNEAGVYSLGTVSGTVSVDAISAMILVKGDVEAKPVEPIEEPASTNWGIVIGVVAAVAVLSAAVVVLLLKKKQ